MIWKKTGDFITEGRNLITNPSLDFTGGKTEVYIPRYNYE